MSADLRAAVAGLSAASTSALAHALAAREGLGGLGAAAEPAIDAWRATPAAAMAASVAPARPAESSLPAVSARATAPEAPGDNAVAAAPAPPTEDARGRETVVVPAQVSAFHAEAPREPARRETPGEARPQRRRRAFANGDADAQRDGDGDDPGDDAQDDTPETGVAPTSPRPVRDDGALYRVITDALQAAAQSEALRELAHGRRIWVVSPRAQRGSSASNELTLRLLGHDVSGAARVRAYRARGQRAANERDAGAWCTWRIHRDAGADGEPRIVAGKGRVLPPRQGGTLALRLARGRLAAPLRDAATAWLDMLDVQRLLSDLGSQWCVTLVWAPHALGAT